MPVAFVRIFLVGASGVIGTRLIPLLRGDGHTVVGMTRSPSKSGLLRSLGAEPVVCDIFDPGALREALRSARPDVVINEATDLPDDPALIQQFGPANNRIRREGTSNVLAAGKEAGAKRFLAQSVAWTLPGEGGRAALELERMVLEAGGTVLRYGQLYGPGTYHEEGLPSHPRIHVDEAARRTVAALSAPPGVVTVVEVPSPTMGAELEVLPATVADAEEILALQKLAYRSEAELYGYQLAPLTQTLVEIRADFSRQRFLKARVGGKTVGSVRARSEGSTCHIGRLVVHPDFQNRGIGKALMREVEGMFSDCLRFELFTGSRSSKNIGIYQRLGYVAFREEAVDENLTLLSMEKTRGGAKAGAAG